MQHLVLVPSSRDQGPNLRRDRPTLRQQDPRTQVQDDKGRPIRARHWQLTTLDDGGQREEWCYLRQPRLELARALIDGGFLSRI